MSLEKQCSKCGETKRKYKDFYICGQRLRSECKVCTIKTNTSHQKATQAWKTRYPDDEVRKLYFRSYYAKNKEKFAKYRHEFKLRYPKYFRDYQINKKRKETESPSPTLTQQQTMSDQ